MSDFTIEAADWHLRGAGAHADPERVIARLSTLKTFLVENGLVEEESDLPTRPVQSGFLIRRSDLNDVGFELIRTALDRWTRSIDKGGDPSSSRTLARALAKLRSA